MKETCGDRIGFFISAIHPPPHFSRIINFLRKELLRIIRQKRPTCSLCTREAAGESRNAVVILAIAVKGSREGMDESRGRAKDVGSYAIARKAFIVSFVQQSSLSSVLRGGREGND